MDYRIVELLNFIERDYAKPHTLGNLAKSLNLSVSHLQHLFKEETGKCITKYIKEVRLKKAAQLLRNTHLRVKEIRVKTGFPDDSHFLHAFKQEFGKTPTNYRNQQKKAEMASK